MGVHDQVDESNEEKHHVINLKGIGHNNLKKKKIRFQNAFRLAFPSWLLLEITIDHERRRPTATSDRHIYRRPSLRDGQPGKRWQLGCSKGWLCQMTVNCRMSTVVRHLFKAEVWTAILLPTALISKNINRKLFSREPRDARKKKCFDLKVPFLLLKSRLLLNI